MAGTKLPKWAGGIPALEGTPDDPEDRAPATLQEEKVNTPAVEAGNGRREAR